MSARNCLGAALALLMGVGIGWMGARLWTESHPHTETPAPHGAARDVSTPRTPPNAASQSRLAKRWKRIEEGSEAARLDLPSALEGLEAMKHPEEYGGLLEGIFSYLAETAPPAEAMRHALALSNPVQRHYALRIVAETWLADDLASPYGSGGLTNDGKGMIVKAAHWLNRKDSTAPPGAARAWLEAFADHPARAELAAAYAETHFMEDPQAQLARAKEFTSWERDQFLQTALSVWAAEEPEAALAWARSRSEPLPAAVLEPLFSRWVMRDAGAVERLLPTMGSEAEREAALRAWAGIKTLDGTEAAVKWADSLADPAWREAAHEAIYEKTPRGIGAVMGSRDGFPTVMEMIPGGAAAQAGLQRQDRLVEIVEDGGEPVPLHGRELSEVVNVLRGEAGTTTWLRVLRPGPDGKVSEHVLQIERKQLIMPSTWGE